MRKSTLLKIINESIEEGPGPFRAKTVEEAKRLLREGKRVENISSFSDSYDVMSLAVQRNGKLLKICSRELRNNDSVVFAAISNYGLSILHANKRFLSDKEAVVLAFYSSGGKLSLNDVDPKFKKDEEAALAAIYGNFAEFYHIDPSLRENKEFMSVVRRIIEENNETVRRLPEEERSKKKVIAI